MSLIQDGDAVTNKFDGIWVMKGDKEHYNGPFGRYQVNERHYISHQDLQSFDWVIKSQEVQPYVPSRTR